MSALETAGKVLSLASRFQPAVASEAVATPEVALVEAVRAGDREAFGRLYALYAPMVHGILLARVPYRDVDDLVQDVFLSALKRLGALRDAAAFGGWLAMIARNRAVDYYRRARETEELTDEMPVASHRDAEAEHEAARMLEAVRSLPEAYRETRALRLGARRPFFWLKYAAAAMIVMALAGAWLLIPRNLSETELHAILKTPPQPILPGVVDSAPNHSATTSVDTQTSTSRRSAVAIH